MTTSDSLFDLYQPLIFKLDLDNNSNILDTSNEVIFSNNIAYPEISLGFNHFIHKTKDKTEDLNDYMNRKKVYLVTSLFEKNIDKRNEDVDHSIDFAIHKFIKDKIDSDAPRILSRAFLKIWEIIIYFDLIPDSENFVSAHVAEGPGSFIQATILYRDLLEKLKKIKSTKKDKYYGVTLDTSNKHLQIEKDFINYYTKGDKRLNIMDTIPTVEFAKLKDSKFSNDLDEKKDLFGGSNILENISDGDITDLQTINLFNSFLRGGAKDFPEEEADLVTADGGFDWKDENLQEQEAYALIFGEIVTALKVQKNGGNFVIKIFETFTSNTLKFIEILKNLYKEVYICKPFTSRASNSEKYVVCKNYVRKNFTKNYEKKLDEMVSAFKKNTDYKINTIFPDYHISKQDFDFYKFINQKVWLKQYEAINNMIKFIKLDNKNGVEYHEFLAKQIEASTFWNGLFLDNSNYPKIYNYVNNLFKKNKDKSSKNIIINNNKINQNNKSSKNNEKTRIIKNSDEDSITLADIVVGNSEQIINFQNIEIKKVSSKKGKKGKYSK